MFIGTTWNPIMHSEAYYVSLVRDLAFLMETSLISPNCNLYLCVFLSHSPGTCAHITT